MHQKREGECVGGFFALILVLVPSAAFAQESTAAASNKGFTTVKEIFQTSCSACHDWTDSYDTVVAGGKIVPGSPEQSVIYQRIADDSMPQAGDKLTAAQKALIRAWIAAGAPQSDQPIVVAEAVPASPSAGTPLPSAPPAAVTTAPPAPAPNKSFLLFPNKVAFHKATGFTATALFFGAGILGAIHFVDMMNTGHYYRDNVVYYQEGMPESLRTPYVIDAWASDSTLRWFHVGFVAGGEVLYLGDAITGLSMLSKHQPGKITKSDIHRWAFFTHVTLMAAQVVLGFLETSALQQGNHDTMVALGAAHAGIGLAIPVVMLGAGLENIFLKE